MSTVVKIIHKLVFSHKISDDMANKKTNEYLSIEEVIRRYEELSSK